MQVKLKLLLLCGLLPAAVFTLVSCGTKTEFEKVDVETTTAVSAIQPAAVDVVPVLTEPHVTDESAETTTRRRTNNRRDNTSDAPAQAPVDDEPSADTEPTDEPDISEPSAEPEGPATSTEPTEASSELDPPSAEPTAPDSEDAE